MAYYVDSWDEEDLEEIRKLLNKPTSHTECGQLRGVLKKILSQITRGVDMSALFTEIVKVCASMDMIEKKLAYLYVTTYAHKKPDVALLAVNTMQKDCRDSNPMVRGLALRTLCSIRLPELIEYTQQPLLSGLKDKSAYVRRVAVLGCTKINSIGTHFVADHGIINTLYEMLRDTDVIVVTNCMLALDELLQNEGGMVVNQKIAHYLANRLSEFTEWGQCCVLQSLLKYKPQNDDEIFDMMNVVDAYLKHTNSGVSMAAVRLMLHISHDMTEVRQDVYKRLKGPLLNLLSSDRPELVYASLCHLEWLHGRAPGKLGKYYKKFFCRYNDPGYVKCKKVELLALLCSEESLQDIVEELSVYATDVSVQLAQLAISALGRLAKMHPALAQPCIQALLNLMSLQLDSVSSQVLVVFQDILRYEHLQEHVSAVVERLPNCLDIVHEARGRAALVWLLAQCGQSLPESPYILEDMIDSLDEEPSILVKLNLLSATAKMFFERPAECQDMLAKVLEHCIESDNDPDLQEKARLYYRLLNKDVHKAKSIICSCQPLLPTPLPEDVVAESATDPRYFNSISLLFSPEKWQEIQHSKINCEADDVSQFSPSDNETLIPLTPEWTTPETGQLLDLNETEVTPEVKLATSIELLPEEFEGKWNIWQSSEMREIPLRESLPPSKIHQRLETFGCKTMATTPEDSNPWRAFLYAEESSSSQLCLIQVTFCSTTDLLTFDIRCESGHQSVASTVAGLLQNAVSGS